jgi:hypothetical protein
LPAPRFQHGFANDVFISYTHEDDNEEAGVRWVSRFETALRGRLAKVSGQSIQTWRDDRLSGADRFRPEIEQQLLTSAVLVPIVTPSYFHSEWCTAERVKFVESARANRGLDVGNMARMIKVAKTRVPLASYPEDLRELLEFRFYVEEPNGTAREFHLSPAQEVQQRFDMVVDDVAQAIEKILRGLEAGAAPSSRGFVYLGETSSDVDTDRDQLRRSLVHRGYSVLPQMPLRLRSGPEAERLVKSDLKQCRLAVYPVGAYYGPVLEGSGDRSLTELQLEAALGDGRNGSLVRIVWLPSSIAITEERQRRFLDCLRKDLPSKGFELIESPLSEIETHITDRLEPPAPPAEEEQEEDRLEVYLMCLPADRQAARLVGDYLFAEGFEVKLPPASGEGAAALHLRRLETADAIVVFWGTADEGWLEPVVIDLKRAKGLRKGKPILSRAIFLADPSTPEKGDYRTHHATVLQGFSDTPVSQALRPLLSDLGRANAGGTR